MATATIKLFLVQGDPAKLRTAEISNWNGKALAAPRSEIEALLERSEMSQVGVYLLIGTDSLSGNPALYIGEAESLRDRLKSHLKDKDFWTHVISIISNDEVLTKAHIRYLEGKLIDDANKAGRAKILNSQSSGSKLPESDRADMDVFLEKIHQLLPVLGANHLTQIVEYEPNDITNTSLLFCEIKGLKASGQLTANGFVVFKGSQAVLENRPSTVNNPWPAELREKLIRNEILKLTSDHLLFEKDAEFSSPSTAAAVIHGGTANGLTAWKNNKGKTLKEIESQQVL
ncbi:MAG: GIY-YIG nuclease family protein [Nitrospinota bacterium]|nr:GIY-YIG nuclease family protein [Nitrospinota bacterium]